MVTRQAGIASLIAAVPRSGSAPRRLARTGIQPIIRLKAVAYAAPRRVIAMSAALASGDAPDRDA